MPKTVTTAAPENPENNQQEWYNFKFYNNQVNLRNGVNERTGKDWFVADCHFMPDSKINGIDLGDQNGIRGRMSVFLSKNQFHKVQEAKIAGEQISIGVPSSQLENGKIAINFYNPETKEAYDLKIPPLQASKANKNGHEAFVAKKEIERTEAKLGHQENRGTSLADKAAELNKAQEAKGQDTPSRGGKDDVAR